MLFADGCGFLPKLVRYSLDHLPAFWENIQQLAWSVGRRSDLKWMMRLPPRAARWVMRSTVPLGMRLSIVIMPPLADIRWVMVLYPCIDFGAGTPPTWPRCSSSVFSPQLSGAGASMASGSHLFLTQSGRSWRISRMAWLASRVVLSRGRSNSSCLRVSSQVAVWETGGLRPGLSVVEVCHQCVGDQGYPSDYSEDRGSGEYHDISAWHSCLPVRMLFYS